MSTDELSFKKRSPIGDDDPLAMDPPILVGGGGSTYVWVRLDMGGPEVDPKSDDPDYGIKPGSKKPKNRNSYTCQRNKDSPKSVIFCNGTDPELVLDIKNKNKWYIRVED
jgi:hypothetical protein